MGRPASLSRASIIAAAALLVREQGVAALTARRLGEALGCDPTAVYRHFATMADLEREVGDRFLRAVDVRPRAGEGWRATTRRICVTLRRVQLRQPRLAALISAAPTRLANEMRITEALLRELARGGCSYTHAAASYHALIELAVGSAAIDAPIAAQPAAVRRRLYGEWRREYAKLPFARFPASVATSDQLYRGSAGDRFEAALDLLLDGIESRCSTR
ncbi:MAG: TetR/AcrR family transcriptional regulator C-terminal domain-containing protein [Actinobacteria bacterium]|nr:TetR/AcrR family transcriptional regulator C-terminal domain-containing protein [Actinomycetota bacterium]